MKKKSFCNIFILLAAVILSIYCIKNLIVTHEALVQIEHEEPLSVASQNAVNIHTENSGNGYITNVILPSGIFTANEKLEIKSNTKQNVVFKLSGPKVAYKDSYKKYKIVYDNVRVNNEMILLNVTASFLEPFHSRVENAENVIINFDYKTGFVLRNMSIINLVVAVILVISIVVYSISQSTAICNFIKYNKLNCNDISLLTVSLYKNIRKEYKMVFWINLITLTIVYSYLMINFLHGNHDWHYIKNDDSVFYSIAYCRFSIPIINSLTEYKYLPFINHFLTFIFVSLTPIFLVKYWKIPVTIFNLLALSSILVLHPQLMGVMYFLHLSYTYLLAPLLIVIALILSEIKDYRISILSVLILVFAIGDYNTTINTLAAIFLGKMLLEFAKDGSFIQLVKKYFRTICVILISLLIYFIIIQYIKYLGQFHEGYNTTLLPVDQILSRTLLVFIESFKHIYSVYPFLDMKYLVLLSLLFIPMLFIMFYETVKRKSIVYLMGLLFLLVLLIFGSQIISCVAQRDVTNTDYIYYFSLPYVYTCVIAFILNSRILLTKNLLFLLLIPICYCSILRDFEFQKFWKIGLDGDKAIMTNLVDKIGQHDNFIYNQSYKIILIGEYSSFNSVFFQRQYEYDNLVIHYPFFASGFFPAIEHYFVPQVKFDSLNRIGLRTSVDSLKELFSDVPKEYIMNLQPWPHKNSVVVYKNKIIVCWQENVLEYVKKVLMEQPESHTGE